MNDAWNEKVVIVTGGSRGLGLALTKQLEAAGACVFVIARGREAWEQNASPATRSEFIEADVCDANRAAAAIRQVVERAGKLDWLVNNVGASTRVDLATATSDVFASQMQVNFFSTVHCTQAALPQLIASRGGVINIASLAAKTPWPWMGPYVTSKAAVAAYTDQLRLEIKALGTVLLVCPGPIQRDDEGNRYDQESRDLPQAARQPGAGARIKGLNVEQLAGSILQAAAAGRRELVLPRKAGWLFKVSALSPTLGDWLRRRFSSR